jgi:hypothetical protein
MAASASPFIIEELTGQKRLIRLSGRALPYRPFNLSGDQRHDLTWYQGSPEGTLQVLGAKENQTSINGWWKDRYIRPVELMSPEELREAGIVGRKILGQFGEGGNGAFSSVAGQEGSAAAQVNGVPLSVRELAEEIDNVRREGQFLKVSWMHLVRSGLLAKFDQKWHTAQDLEWSITFTWINQGIDLAELPVQTGSLDLADSVSEIQNQLSAIEVAFGAGTTNPRLRDTGITSIKLSSGAPFKALKEIERSILDVKLASLALEKTVVTNVKTVLSPIASLRRSAGVFNFIKQRAANILKSLDKVLAVLLSAADFAFGSVLAERTTFRDQRRAALRIMGIAAIRQEQLEKRLEPELIDSFIARENQDLRDVATLHYGTPDGWQALKRFNELSSSKLEAGQLIFVPRNPPRGDC